MKVATTILLLFCTLEATSAQNAPTPVDASFTAAVDTLRTTMLKLSSIHKLTAADGKVLPYNVSILDVSANPSLCTVTWKNRVDLGSMSMVTTNAVNVRGIQKLNSVSSLHSKMIVDPFIQIVQIHMFAYTPLAQTTERFYADGRPMSTPETDQVPVAIIYTSSVSEAGTVIKELTDAMTKCIP